MGYLTWAVVPLLAILIPSYLFYLSSPYFSIVDFVSYSPLPKIPLEGILAPNDKLKSIKRFAEGILIIVIIIVFIDIFVVFFLFSFLFFF